jgi:hypothetical protein
MEVEREKVEREKENETEKKKDQDQEQEDRTQPLSPLDNPAGAGAEDAEMWPSPTSGTSRPTVTVASGGFNCMLS